MCAPGSKVRSQAHRVMSYISYIMPQYLYNFKQSWVVEWTLQNCADT